MGITSPLRWIGAAILVGLATTTAAQAQCGTASCPSGAPILTTNGDQFVSPDISWDPNTVVHPDYVTLKVPQITLGAGQTLVQVEVEAAVTRGGPVGYTNNNNNACVAGSLTIPLDMTLNGNGVNLNWNADAPVPLPASIDPNGVGNFTGTINVPSIAIPSACVPLTGGNTAPFVGAGMVEFDHSAISGQALASCSNLAINPQIAGTLAVTVRYYVCATVTNGCPCVRDPRSPSSLLLFPEFCNDFGRDTLVTITNANCFTCSTDNNLPAEVIVEVVFIDKDTCLEDNFNIPLTPCDTYTFMTRSRTNLRQGYIYAFAKNTAGQAISFNHLVGQEVLLDGFRNMDWSINASGFRAIPPEGEVTDIDNDNIRDLDNLEYIAAPERIIIPRFLGQDPFPFFFADYRSTLTFIALSGGAQFSTIVDISIWNDSEECFSDQHQFRCWDKQFLADISPAFRESFLDATNDDPQEIIGWNDKEAGWIYINGRSAFSGIEQINNPAIYALLIEEKSGRLVADLPWEEGCQDNGDLLPLGILGDPRPGFPGGINGDNQ